MPAIRLRRPDVLLATVIACAAGCVKAPARSGTAAPSAGRANRGDAGPDTITLAVLPSRRLVLAVGDTLQLRPQLFEHYSDAAFGLPMRSTDAYRWRSTDPEVASVGDRTGLLMARSVGEAIVEVEGDDRGASATIAVIPPVAGIRWEPAELRLRVGESAVVRGVALDATGGVVALLPLTSVGGMQGVLASAVQSQAGGWIRVRAELPGTTWLTTNLGSREAQLRVTIQP